jgi:hypothetical protein
VRGVTKLDPDEDPENYDLARAYVHQTLETGAGTGPSLAMSDVDRHIRG